MAKEETVAFSDKERALIEAVAKERGLSFEDVANVLAHEALARRVRKRTGRNPSANVRRLSGKK